MAKMMTSTIRSPPSLSDYIPLSEHQAQTPETFYGGKPILYYHGIGAKAWVPSSQRGILPIFAADASSAPTAPENAALSGSSEEIVEQKVDLFVNSETLTIFSPSAETGVTIPYPLISIHAIKTLGFDDKKFASVYLQLELADGGACDDDFETVELTLIPASSSPTEEGGDKPSETSKLFEAISECSNLNPDPVEEGDEDDEDERIIFEADHEALEGYTAVYTGARDGGLPPPMPGSSGWITADNVHEFFDADGNWIGGEEEGVSGELGDGAGTVHSRDEEETNGHEGAETADSKRPRTD
ncbi:regulator of volume decrease after cellular swelling-domain-containing protein [Podospora aff. communis PSN243]|uniref:Regulator of volume decrease after cellular swelling-domain-containing protein n=1 Tax=Podospora aff. communis PSN243 TaxID=3040156 RepID=A0AAV9GW89_9PEZI|nr:regulator of volume decrease after cellular swelling-domain-containing protein [Podospora aff. communis PSN243]